MSQPDREISCRDVTEPERPPATQPADELEVLRRVVRGTAAETGERFFNSLVENLAAAMGTCGAWVTEYLAQRRSLRPLAFWLGDGLVEGREHGIDGTPCQVVVEGRRLVHFADRVRDIYPHEPRLMTAGAASYLGVPLTDVDGSVLGHLAVLDQRPMPENPQALAIFEIFAARAAAELRRLRAEREVREREEKLAHLVGSAMDAIVELDENLCIARFNRAAQRIFDVPEADAQGMFFADLLEPQDVARFQALAAELGTGDAEAGSRWIPHLLGRRAGGPPFPAEASLSSFVVHGRRSFTVILRNVDERLEAERRIRSLTDETLYLRQELRELGQFDEILGRSPALAGVLRDVQEVAPTDTTVLILGETGTGKELFARAIQGASGRRDKPFVKVNCAAMPANLIESELFGHERGAFTGASARREGRFALADGGTLFLDEIGELPVELQPKLLRVLQEGEFEPVGSDRTRKVDVRVIAATNRDLLERTKAGSFRQDLYYRLSVFPITLPPLRDRGDDAVLLADALARRIAGRMGRAVSPLTPAAAARLRAYPWPGNVRELQNVIERAVITARDGQLNFDRAFPASPPAPRADDAGSPQLLTSVELVRLERDNLHRALERSGWQVAGESGAARLLGMAPSTLTSRMKALGVHRPG
ncbi:MAG TPA: sigma 54-interacting transcriptional regulator [Myxococcales bacterium]|nr:sigma 54-interacting transcriptional regulator [Myxococcales bacterium]